MSLANPNDILNNFYLVGFFKSHSRKPGRTAGCDAKPIHNSRFDAPYGNKCRRGYFISGRLPAPCCAEAASSSLKCEIFFNNSAPAASRSLYTHSDRVRQGLPAPTLEGGDARQHMLIRRPNERQLDRRQRTEKLKEI